MILAVFEDSHSFHKTNIILNLGEYNMSNNFCLKLVLKELKVPSSLHVSWINVPVKAVAFPISVGLVKWNQISL